MATEAPKPRYKPEKPSALMIERAIARPDLAGGGGARREGFVVSTSLLLLLSPLPLLSMIISRWLTTSTGTVKNCVTREATAPPTALAAPAFCGSERRGMNR